MQSVGEHAAGDGTTSHCNHDVAWVTRQSAATNGHRDLQTVVLRNRALHCPVSTAKLGATQFRAAQMDQFEFFMVIAGVVVAMAMTEIVAGWGRLIRADVEVELDWVHLGWTICVLLVSLGYWVGMWPYVNFEIRYTGQFWFLVFPTLFLVLLAYALTPELPKEGKFSLRDYYLRKRLPIFLSFIVFLVTAGIADVIIAGSNTLDFAPMLAPTVVFCSVYAGLAVTERMWAHRAGVVITFVFWSSQGFVLLSESFERFYD